MHLGSSITAENLWLAASPSDVYGSMICHRSSYLRISMSDRICWEKHSWQASLRCWICPLKPSHSASKVGCTQECGGSEDENVKWSFKILIIQYERHMDDVRFSRSWMMLMHSNFWHPRSACLLLEFQGQDMGTIRLLRYPPAETAEEAARRQVASYGISPHTDFEVP